MSSEALQRAVEGAMDDANQAAAVAIRFGFLKLVVADLPAMTAFYELALGLAPLRTIETGAMTETVMGWRDGGSADFRLILYHPHDGRELSLGAAYGPIGLSVPDVDAAFARAVAHGAQVQTAPYDLPIGRIAFVRDPEGREIEFIAPRGA